MREDKKQYFYTDRGFFRNTVNDEAECKRRFADIHTEVTDFCLGREISDWREKVYRYLHDVTVTPKCKCGCGQDVEFGKVAKSSRFGYNVFYSRDCKKNAYGGEGNPFFNKTHSQKTKDILRQKNVGKTYSAEVNAKKSLPKEKNGMFGRRNYDVWLEKYGEVIAKEKEAAANAKKGRNGKLNGMYGRSPGKKAGNSIKCWYKEFYCRSLTELSFIVNYCERFHLTCATAETDVFRVTLPNGSTYKPDFIVNGKYVVEVKPKAFHYSNAEKFEFVKKELASRGYIYKVIDPIQKLAYNDVFSMILTNKVRIQVVENGKAYNNFIERYNLWLRKRSLLSE